LAGFFDIFRQVDNRRPFSNTQFPESPHIVPVAAREAAETFHFRQFWVTPDPSGVK